MLSNVRFNGVKSYKTNVTGETRFILRNGRVKGQSSQSHLPMTKRCNNPIHYSVRAWVQAFGAKIFGIVWLDKRYLWLVNGWIPSTNHNQHLAIQMIPKALHPKPVPHLPFVSSQWGNRSYVGSCCQGSSRARNVIGQVTIGVSFNLIG